MEERPRRDVSDGWCRNCKTRKSIREGSFFSKSIYFNIIIYYYINNILKSLRNKFKISG